VNLLESLPYEAPEEVPAEEIDVIDEEEVEVDDVVSDTSNDDDELDENGQVKLF